MADDYEAFLRGEVPQAPSSGPVPVQSGAGEDEYARFLGATEPAAPAMPPVVAMPGAPNPEGDPEAEYNNFLKGPTSGKSYLGTLGDLFGGGVKRNMAQFEAMPDMLRALSSEYRGDSTAAQGYAQSAVDKTKAAGEPQYDLTKIHDVEDFSYWLTEKLGENAATLAAMAFTGGVGALSARVAAQKMLERGLISQAAARSVMLAGAAVPAYTLSTSMETAGTGSEIFEATGQVTPGIALGAGAVKGALELWAPLSVARSIISPGAVLGKTFTGAVAKVMAKEGSTELAQESIDIAARKYMDPNYSFFNSGVDSWLDMRHPGIARLAEAGAAGAAVGGVYGGPFAKMDQNKEQKPGERVTLPGDPSLKGDEDFVNKIAGALQEPPAAPPSAGPSLEIPQLPTGPITALRQLVLKPEGDKTVRQATATNGPMDDLMGLGPLLRLDVKQDKAEQAWDMLDKETSRYVVKGPDGRFGSEVFNSTELTLDNVVKLPQNVRPDYHKVDPGSLSPAGITARIQDLGGPEKVWFLPGVTPVEKQQLMAEYQKLYQGSRGQAGMALQNKAGYTALEDAFKPTYDGLLNRGLRVLPSRGAGFYYSGVMKAEPADPVGTTADKRVGLYDPRTGMVSPFRPGLEGYFPEGAARDKYNFGLLPDVFDGQVPVSLDLAKMDPGSYRETPDGSLELLEKVDFNKLIPGMDLYAHNSEQFENQASGTAFEGNGTVANYVTSQDDAVQRMGMKLEEGLKEIRPLVTRVLQSLGVEDNVFYTVVDHGNVPSAAYVYVDTGQISIDAKLWTTAQWIGTGDLKVNLKEVVMHEVGHMVTMHYWKGLPLEVQGQLLYAWEKANLARRMDAPGNGSLGDMRALLPLAAKINQNSAYYTQFGEWLAEQFRRWVGVDPQAVNWQDQALKNGSKVLEDYYKRWEGEFGKLGATNLRNPDYHFSGVMEYLRQYGKDKEAFKQRLRQQELYHFDDAFAATPASLAIATQVEAAIVSLQGALPAGVSVLGVQKLSGPEIGDHAYQSRGQMLTSWTSHLPYIELAVNALPKGNLFEETRSTLSHELMHTLEVMGLLTEQEIVILDNAIARGPDPLGEKAAVYRREYTKQLEEFNTPEQTKEMVDFLLDRERRAFYFQEFANTGLARDEQSRTIMVRILQLIEQIGNYIRGLGFQSRDDVIRAIFRGEVARRSETMSKADLRNALRDGVQIDTMYQLDLGEYLFDKVEQAGKYTVGVAYEGGSKETQEGKLLSKHISYIFFREDGSQAGFVDLKNKMPKGFEIEMINTKKGDGFSGMAFTNYIEQDLGIPMKLAGILLDDGFQQGKIFARKRAGIKDLETYYQPVVRKDGTVQYYSPNKTLEMVGLWTRIVQMMQTPAGVRQVNDQFADILKQIVQPGATSVKLEERMTQKRAIAILASWKAFEKRFPPEVWTSPKLDYMFQLDKLVRQDGVQMASVRAAQQETADELLKAMDGAPKRQGMTAQEHYQAKLDRYKVETAKEMGWRPEDVGAPLMATVRMHSIFKTAWEGAEGALNEKLGTHPQRLNQHLAGQIKIMDRMNAFWKWLLTIKQIAQKNPHIAGLRDYVNHEEIMKQISQRWVRRAEETARRWEGVGSTQREAISRVLFDLVEMKYRNPTEVGMKVVRLPKGWAQFLAGQPAQLEVAQMLRAAKLNNEAVRIVRQVAQDFQDFLAEVEALRATELAKTFANDPAALQAAVAKLTAEMAAYRMKPYFPMVRFGQFTTVVRNSMTGKVIWAAAYDNQAQRDRAIEEVRRQFPGDDITLGRASEAESEFMSLPGPLLRLIQEKMNKDQATALTAEQTRWFEEFEMLNGPDSTFARRWMPSEGMPGYSLDGFRAYAHYFQSGSRYIARLAKMDDLQTAMLSVQTTIQRGGRANSAKLQMIHDYMKAHYKYIMEPGQDAGKLRAFISLWYLGFAVPSAVLNLTQLPMMTFPLLTKDFGGLKALGAFNGTLTASKNTVRLRRGKNGLGDPRFAKARDEAIYQGLIDVGQAAELGGFAEGYNLHKLLAGNKIQKAWRNLSWAGMYMFGLVEQFNRELTFQMAWELAMANPKAPRVSQIDSVYNDQIVELRGRTGMTWQEAVSFLYAKEMVDRSQFSYDKSADAQFMRGGKKDLLIFFKYTQNALFTMSHNGKGTAVHMLLWYMALYGLMGLPGSEDLNELVRALAKKIGGKDWDIHGEVRKFVRDLTRGTRFDETGPDLFMHGISRYGMGPSLFTEHYWPAFDVSSNGSMGRIIPGFAELMHGMGTDKKYADIFAESAQKASGAAYGMAFPLMKFIMEPHGTVDSKKWEQLLPRFVKGYTGAIRYLPEGSVDFGPLRSRGGETDSTGAKIVPFDVTDQGDLLTVIAKALSFQPRRVNETYEMLRDTRDLLDIYQARRVALYAQMDKALKVGDTEVVLDVIRAMQGYNDEVKDYDPSMQMKVQQIVQSLKARQSGRAMQENFLSRNRSQIPVTQRMLDLYPGLQAKRVR